MPDSSSPPPPDPVATQRELEARLAERTAALERANTALQISAARHAESQLYFEKSFVSSPAIMAIAHATTHRLLEVNAAFLAASGYTREEVLGRSTQELGLWVRPAQREEFVGRLRVGGHVRDFEADFRRKTGETISFLLSADLLEIGGAQAMLTIGFDITERRRREQVQAATYQISQVVLSGGDLTDLFAEVHRILSGLMDARNFYVALLSPDGSELSFPYFVDEYVSQPPPRAPGNGFTEYVLHSSKPMIFRAEELSTLLRARGYHQPLDRPAAQRLGAPLVIGGRAIGVIALQHYTNPRAFGPEHLRLLTFVAEQTAAAVHRRQAESDLAVAEKNYRSLFENAPEGLYQTTIEGRFRAVNAALAKICGYPSPAALIAAVNDIGTQLYVNPGRREEFFQLIQSSDEVTDFESEIRRPDGSTLWISESVRAVRDARGQIDHFEGVAIDITQQREAARAMQAAKEAADAANRSKSRFLASVSHEFRTPLNGILGYTQILNRDAQLTERQREGVRVIHESADHLLALINDVLDLSKIEAGRLELEQADFDLPAFAAGVEQVFLPRAREKNLLLETAVAADVPRYVRGDEQRLRQIVYNLVGNAVKFTARGGVVFSVRRSANGRINFSVSDTGPGIAKEHFAIIFEPFTQLRESGAAATGTGLGLGISRSLVERMGGKLVVESGTDWGTRFSFEIELPTSALETLPVAVVARRVLGYEGARRRVLAVDDNAANRSVMTGMLSPLGFELTEAATGEEALAKAASVQPDLILMDLRLPSGIDGLEATRRLRAGPLGSRVKIIAVSASAYDLDRHECFAAGCDDFLAKPFREEALWAAIGRALQLKWIYADEEITTTPFPLVMHAPTPAESDALHELASRGDVVALRARAQALADSDPRLAPFAHGILSLAVRFKMKAIRQFIDRHRNLPPLPPHA
jgi:PAS domain S-box-containing protein